MGSGKRRGEIIIIKEMEHQGDRELRDEGKLRGEDLIEKEKRWQEKKG